MNSSIKKAFPSLLRFFAVALLIANAGCVKEFSYEYVPPAPVDTSTLYKLIDCSDAKAAGSFVAGASLGTDAIMTVAVDVTRVGDWNYSTETINGFYFTGAGTFTQTGKQVIVLMSGGTPTTAGNFDFELTIGDVACKVTVGVSTPGGPNPFIQGYYRATIAGTSYHVSMNDTEYKYEYGKRGVDDVVFEGGVVIANPPRTAGKTEFRMEIGVMHNYTTATISQFRDFIAFGYHSYASINFNSDGVKLYWTDGNGDVWETRNGAADQPGSRFQITGKRDYVNDAGNFCQVIRALFNCKLYNLTSGAVKAASGEISLPIAMQ